MNAKLPARSLEENHLSSEQLFGQIIEGTHAYSEKSIERGETIHLRVSSTNPYKVSIVRLGTDPDSPAEDTEIFDFGEVEFTPQAQPIYPGSFVNIEPEIPTNEPLLNLTLECWVRLWPSAGITLNQWRGIISQHSYPDKCGFGLFLNADDRLVAYAGSRNTYDRTCLFSSAHLLTENSWHHVVAVFDLTAECIKLYLDGNEESFPVRPGLTIIPGTAPLRIGAYGENGVTGHLLDGDIALPIIYNRSLAPSEVQSRYIDKGKSLPPVSDILGCWPLDEEKGSSIHDISPFERHGSIVNYGSWMIGGPSLDPTNVDDNYDPTDDPDRGHGLRLSSDDLYDCEWNISHEFTIPEDAKPGVYVSRIKYGRSKIYDVPFVVKKKIDDHKASILVLCNTNTWLAYNSAPFAANDDGLDQLYGIDGPNNLEKRTGFSCYRNHHLNQPTFQIGINLPWPNTRPYISYFKDQDNESYSHLLRAERFLHIWLEGHSYDYDVITEFDLVTNPETLLEYQAFIIVGHSEYWSAQGYDAIKQYLEQDGHIIVLSGNTALWRVSFDEELTVMECRKCSGFPTNSIADSVKTEESFHSHDGLRGGVLRRNGYQVSELLGLETAGYSSTELRSFEIINPNHYLFKTPYSIDMSDLTAFGTRSVGHEWDVLYAGVNLPAVEILGRAPSKNGDSIWNYDVSSWSPLPSIANIMYWERPSGGYVFYIGSIAASRGLFISDINANNQLRMSLLLENVLSNFLGFEPSRFSARFNTPNRKSILNYNRVTDDWSLTSFTPTLATAKSGNTSGFGRDIVNDGRPFWVGDFNGDGKDEIIFYYPGDQNWWLGTFTGNTLSWDLAGNTAGFGQVADGRPFWVGDFTQAGKDSMLFYFPGDDNWWIGTYDGNDLQWALAGNTAGFGRGINDGRPFWVGDFNGDGKDEIIFYYPGDQNWWLGTFTGNTLSWDLAGNTAGFGQVADGRPFWVGDFTQAGKDSLLFYFPSDHNWWIGTYDGNDLQWALAGNS